MRQRRLGDRLGGIAVDERVVGQHALAGGLALLDRNVRLFGIDFDLAAQRRAPRGVARRGDDREDRLAVEIDAVMREHRLVGVRRRNVVLSRNVRRGDDGDDAGRAQHLGKIDPPDACRARPANRRRAICSVPIGSGISSIYSAEPCTCLAPLSCGSGL